MNCAAARHSTLSGQSLQPFSSTPGQYEGAADTLPEESRVCVQILCGNQNRAAMREEPSRGRTAPPIAGSLPPAGRKVGADSMPCPGLWGSPELSTIAASKHGAPPVVAATCGDLVEHMALAAASILTRLSRAVRLCNVSGARNVPPAIADDPDCSSGRLRDRPPAGSGGRVTSMGVLARADNAARTAAGTAPGNCLAAPVSGVATVTGCRTQIKPTMPSQRWPARTVLSGERQATWLPANPVVTAVDGTRSLSSVTPGTISVWRSKALIS